MRSPLLSALADAVRTGVPGAEAAFRRRLEQHGTPLVELDPEGLPDHRLVTFCWADDLQRPATDVLALLHTVTDRDRHAGDLTPHLMRRVPGTRLWAISHRLRADHRASYQFFVAHGPRAQTLRTDREAWLRVLDRAVPDPFNRTGALLSRDGRNPASVLELPDAPPQPWRDRRDGVPRGALCGTRLGGRPVTVHLPAGHGAAYGPYACAVLLDGQLWGPVLGIGDTLDNLHADEALPPTVTLLVDTGGQRLADLGCNAAFVDWLADRLLPWAAHRYAVDKDPSRTVIAGQSAGGLTAAFAAFRRPDRFGRVLSQSGSFWWPDTDSGGPGCDSPSGSEWLTRQYASAGRRPVRFQLEVGRQEWMLLAENRRLRNVLRARGYDMTYAEYSGGHDYACWRGGLATGLRATLCPTDG